jgi:hypothetical protein
MHVHLRVLASPIMTVRHEVGGHMASDVHSGCSADLLIGADWRKSSLSGQMGNCVEVAVLGSGEIAVRNSRHPTGPALVFTPAEWSAFLGGVDRREFTLPGDHAAF